MPSAFAANCRIGKQYEILTRASYIPFPQAKKARLLGFDSVSLLFFLFCRAGKGEVESLAAFFVLRHWSARTTEFLYSEYYFRL